MSKRLRFDVKEVMVSLSGACFWYWNSFYSFLDSSDVPRSISRRYPREAFNKYQAMRNIIDDLEAGGHDRVLDSLISNFYRLRGPIDRDNLDQERAREQLREFRDLVGDDPIEKEIQRQTEAKAKDQYRKTLDATTRAKQQLGDLNQQFLVLAGGSQHTPQQRGFALEQLFFDLLHFCEIEQGGEG